MCRGLFDAGGLLSLVVLTRFLSLAGFIPVVWVSSNMAWVISRRRVRMVGGF